MKLPLLLAKFLVLGASFVSGNAIHHVVEVRETVVTAELAARGYNPLSHLISEGIAFGNSVLSDLMGGPTSHVDPKTTTNSAPTSKTTSDSSASPSSAAHSTQIPISSTSHSSFSSTTKSSASSSSSSSSTAIQPSSTSSSTSSAVKESSISSQTSDPSHSSSGSNHDLVIILGCVIGVLVLALIAACIWLILRRRRKQESTWDSEEGKSITWEENRQAPEWVGTTYPIPSPEEAATEAANDRNRYYHKFEPTARSNPISPIESRHHSCSPIMEEESPPQPLVTRNSVEIEGTPISPVCELSGGQDTGHFAWLPKKPNGNGWRPLSAYPSQRSGVSALDFGSEDDDIVKRSQRRFTIPRRPISALSNRSIAH